MKKIFTLFLFTLLLLSGFSGKSQTDTEFWFAVPRLTQGHGWDAMGGRKFYFRFANRNLPNEITISMPADPDFTPIVSTLAPNEALTVEVTDMIFDLWTENPNQIYDRGIKITATNLTTAYFEVGTHYNPDIFALKGRNALGNDFFVPFQDHFNNGIYNPRPYSGIYIVATQDNTTVTVTPTNQVFPGRPPGVPFDTILHTGQTFAVVPDDFHNQGTLAGSRLGGTRVQSDKPIAISTSDDSVAANPYGTCRDLIGDQLVPTSIIGTEYIAMKGRLSMGGAPTMPEFIYILGTVNHTEVYIDGVLEGIIDEGQQMRWEFTQQNHHILTSERSYVYHVAGFGCEMGGAILPPINVCTGSTKVSFTRSKGESFFLNILSRAGAEDGFIFNGDGPNTVIKASDFVTVPGSTNWLAAEYEMDAAMVPVAVASLIENEKDVFHLGIINGGPYSGTMYGYFSDFNELDIKANISGAGASFKTCFGDPVQLIAHGGVNYQWHPPDYLDDPTSATPISLPEESIKYTVTVSGACKMTDSTSVYVNLYGPASAAFTIEEPSGCSPFDLTVVNESFGISNFSWRMGDGTVYTTAADEFTHTYTNTTESPIEYELLLVGRYSMCRDTMKTQVTVFPEVEALMQPDVISGCAPLTVAFDNYSKGADQYEWIFGDGSSSHEKDPVYQFNNYTSKDTTYYVTLRAFAETGCMDEKTIPIHVKPFIEAKFDFNPPEHCNPYPVTFTNTSYGATTHLWSFDGGNSFQENPQQQFTQILENSSADPLLFEVWLIGENEYGCKDTLTASITVFPEIEARFVPDVLEGCNPLTVEFFNESAGASHYQWEFDHQAGNSHATHPSVVFDNPSLQDTAVYNVRLTAISPYACQDTYEKQIVVYPRIEAEFSFDYISYCTPVELSFQNNSLGGNQFQWDFGDGNQSSSHDQHILHSFVNTTDHEQIFSVTLAIENDFGCTDSKSREVIIYPETRADFQVETSGCHPMVADFSNQSVGAEEFLWTFGDGGHTETPDPQRIFTNDSHTHAQSYTIQLMVASTYGCRDTLEKEITVFPKPKASYTHSEQFGCAPLYTNLTSNSIGTSLLHWDFGDGSPVVTSSGDVAHTYYNFTTSSKLFQSRLIAENDFGCKDTISTGVEVFPFIEASFDVSDAMGCHPFHLEITNTSTGASAATPYFWDYGNGNTSTTQQTTQPITFENNSHTQTAYYPVRLRAESVYGCKDSTEIQIAVLPKPLAAFEPNETEGCSPFTTDFMDASIGAGQYFWSLGGEASTEQQGSFTHTFSQGYDQGTGLVTIGLEIVNDHGCRDTTSRIITVFPDIIADFTATLEGCHPLPVHFQNLSKGADQLQWEFGDGSVSGYDDPQYTYTNSSHTENAFYTVTLHTASVYGCQAELSKLVTVHPKPFSAFQSDVQQGCSPLNVEITNTSIGGSSFSWILGGMPSANSNEQFEHVFSNLEETPQYYQLFLHTENEYGCSRQSFQQIEVFPEVWADFGADIESMTGCNPLPLEFINHSERAHHYQWDFGDGNRSTVSEPFNTFHTPGTQESLYDVRLLARSVYGCRDSIIKKARVLPVPVADLRVSPLEQTFPEKSIRADNLSAPGDYTFTWNMGDGTSLVTENRHTINHEYMWPHGDFSSREFHINLEVSNGYCHDSISQKVVIHAPPPLVSFGPTAQGCPPFEVQFRNESFYGYSYQWDFDDGQHSELENPSHVFHEPGEYMVKLLVSGEGGLDSAFQKITVHELPTASFRVNPSVVQLPYETVRMVNLSSLAAFYEWNMGDGTWYYEAEPEHLYMEPGTYDISLKVGTNTWPQCYHSTLKASAVIAEQGCMIILPDAFTPNTSGPNGGSYIINDPANHVFYPVHTGIKDYELEIYNRWGEFLFRTTDLNLGWDGYYRGKLSSMDVYVWKLRATCHSGKKINKTGDVTLYR